MSIHDFKKNLALQLSSVEEFERSEYAVAITVGSMIESGEVTFDSFVCHSPKKLAAMLTDKAWIALPHLFVHSFGILPTTVVFCHVFDVSKAQIVELLATKFQEAAKLPTPQSIDDVVFDVIRVESKPVVG